MSGQSRRDFLKVKATHTHITAFCSPFMGFERKDRDVYCAIAVITVEVVDAF
jgi:hypothetical protein